MQMQMVGPGRLELPTPRLSSVCSNQLSYGPISVNGQRGFVFMKKEKRGRRSPAIPVCFYKGEPKFGIYRRIALRWSPDWRHLCSKKRE